MFIKEIIIKNFRGYQGEQRIPIGALTAFIGKNDAGKSSIFDALAIFFEHPLGKIDNSDINVRAGNVGELRIGCVFDDLPPQLTIDETSVTTLADEHLLTADGFLELHKVWEFSDATLKKGKIFAVANHPTLTGFSDLLAKKNAELRTQGNALGVTTGIDTRSNVALRRAIWGSQTNLNPQSTDLQLDKEDAKAIWEQLSSYLPEYALFRADRPSTDEDLEVQDPLKVAIKQALEEVQDELAAVKDKVKARALDVANRTIDKLSDFDATLAEQLLPNFRADPKWDTLFKITLSGDDNIPVNKRGSGVRRLILFSFFRAEAERLKSAHHKVNIIYAIEEPETAQHPNNQRKIIEALQTLSSVEGCQVLLTTHVPALASLIPVASVRHVTTNATNQRIVKVADDDVLKDVATDLGIIPDKRVRTLVCVEGPHDIQFLKHINKLCRAADPTIPDIANDHRVAFIVLGGSTLQEWVNQRYLKNLAIPEIHIYDRDQQRPDGTYKYQAAKDAVNARTDGSRGYLTQKRELENYLHIDAINEALSAHAGTLAFTLDDNCDVETEIFNLTGQRRFDRRSLKHWLNDDAAAKMTIARLQNRNSYTEIVDWFREISRKIA
ncbi:MAG: ATP-binding protein [Alphaproteobacteria bacterium]|nr:ATP-binding protein [Alphaproteobacteria bacterium]